MPLYLRLKRRENKSSGNSRTWTSAWLTLPNDAGLVSERGGGGEAEGGSLTLLGAN